VRAGKFASPPTERASQHSSKSRIEGNALLEMSRPRPRVERKGLPKVETVSGEVFGDAAAAAADVAMAATTDAERVGSEVRSRAWRGL
jgi:hypothetical protein